MNKKWDIVEVLRHSRHDWLNRLQLIKGNLALNKLDRVKEIIEEIIIEARHESNLTNLRLNSLAAFLMTYNWEQHHFRIEYEVLGQIRDLSSYDQVLTDWCVRFFETLDQSIDKFGDNHLSISIEITESNIRFFFDFRGIITNKDKLIHWLKENKQQEPIKLNDFRVHNAETTVVITIK
jgi:stage 0 sporulation protein B (sporulation initiation phosphotransferase)